MTGLGVGRCKGGWLAIRLDGQNPTYWVHERLTPVLSEPGSDQGILIDVPMGLPTGWWEERPCDQALTHLLGRAGPGDEPAGVPGREALKAGDHDATRRMHLERTGSELSSSAWSLVSRTREVDDLLTESPAARSRLREARPELVFWALCGRRAMPHPPESREGFLDRVSVLERAWPGAAELAATAFIEHGGFRVTRDEVVAATAVAVAARLPGRWRGVPDEPARDHRGVAMEIVYADDAVWTGPLPSAGPP